MSNSPIVHTGTPVPAVNPTPRVDIVMSLDSTIDGIKWLRLEEPFRVLLPIALKLSLVPDTDALWHRLVRN